MHKDLSSRDRMLLAIDCKEPDYVPMCFMIFSALKEKCSDQYEFIERELQLGLDAVVELPIERPETADEHVDLHGLPIRYGNEVLIREWKQDVDPEPLLFKEYVTPSGVLRTVVKKVRDWKHGDHIPLFDDYLIPRSKEFLVKGKLDLPSLKHVLTFPSERDIRDFREKSRQAKDFARKKGLMVTAGWGVGMDAACWLCGLENLMLACVLEPDFVAELVEIISKWNQARMEVMLDVGVDLFIRRGWYETAEFFPPDIYKNFILPSLKREVELSHQAGTKFGYIMTTGTMPLLDILLESDIDVLIGVDPVQGKGTDLAEIKRRIGGKICIWGGINGFLTVEMGTEDDIRKAVEEAIDILAPGGGFILSPVDNIRDNSERTWKNIEYLIEVWKELRAYDH